MEPRTKRNIYGGVRDRLDNGADNTCKEPMPTLLLCNEPKDILHTDLKMKLNTDQSTGTLHP